MDTSAFNFSQFVPGFDFLKQIQSGGTPAAAPPSWVAPTLDPAEIDKRIQELKTVHFWLDQNAKAVQATIQALEVQRMTVSALQNMNVGFSEMAEALKIKPQSDSASTAASAAPAPEAAKPAKAARKTSARAKAKVASPDHATAQGAGVDPSQWWGALTQQFQHIATQAMQDMARNAQTHAGAPSGEGDQSAAPAAAKKTTGQKAARKTATRSRR